jgi:hypothetical protein
MANWMESSEYPARLPPVMISIASHELLPTGRLPLDLKQAS